MAILAIVAIIPWTKQHGPARWPIILPIASGLLWLVYEHRLRSLYRSDPVIRVDLPLVIVMFVVTVAATAAWQLILRRSPSEDNSHMRGGPDGRRPNQASQSAFFGARKKVKKVARADR